MRKKGRIPGLMLILLATFPVLQQGGLAQEPRPTDETTLRALVNRYFEALTNASVADYIALWSAASPDVQAKGQALERVLAASRLSYTQPRISRFTLAGDRAVLWVTTKRSATRLTEATSVMVVNMAVSLEFVRETGGWKLWRESSAVAELARELIAAETEEERNQLMAFDRELLTRDLMFLLSGQADRYYRSSSYAQALTIQRLVLRIGESIESPVDQVVAWRNIATLQYMMKDYAQAIPSYQRGIALATDGDRKVDLAALWTGLGISYAAHGNKTAAIDAYQKSLVLSRHARDHAGEANAFDAIALLKREEGLYAEAAEVYLQVLPLREALRDRAAVSSTLINLAEVEYEQGEDDRALAYYHQALAIVQAIGRSANLVHILHNIANLYYLQGSYDLALSFYHREREAADAAASLPGAAAALSGIGLVQTLYGDYAASLDAYRLCLAIWREVKSTDEVATALQKIGRVHLAMGEAQKALEVFREAVELRESLQDQREVGWALLDVGSALAVLRDFPQAIAVEERSLSLFESLKDQSGIGAALVHLAGTHFVQENYSSTIDLAGRAAAIAKAAGDTDIFWQARHRQGRAYYRLEQSAPARVAFGEAIASIESRQQTAGESRPQRLLDDRLAPYLGMVDLTIHQSLSGEAFSYAERAKARSLKLIMQGNRYRITRTMTQAEKATEQKLIKDRAILISQITRERERRSPQPARLSALGSRLRIVQREADLFEQNLYRTRPDVKVLRGEGSPIAAERVSALLSTRSSAILEFVETDEEIYLFAFTGGRERVPKLQTYATGITRRDLAERVVYFQDLLARRQEGWEAVARELYDILLKPAEAHFREKAELLIVPDGWLWNLPFGALRNAENSFLIERHAVSIASSLTAFQRMRTDRVIGANARSTRSALDLVAIGSPSLAPAAAQRMRAALRTERVQTEHETDSEVTRLGAFYGPQRSRVYRRAEARAPRVMPDAADARVLHLAVPAALSEASPLYSPIAFASLNEGQSEDGTIQLRDMLSWTMKSELLILSGSEVVPRGQSVGRALTGLSWAGVIAGFPSVLVRQWWVEASPTSELMLTFHQERRPSHSNAIAWQNAVKARLKGTEYRHPYYWASFVFIGRG